MAKTVAVFGGSEANAEHIYLAYDVGKIIAQCGAAVVCGGLGGLMEGVSKGAKENGGLVIGILPQTEKLYANPYVDIVIPTGLGYARNTIVALAGDIAIALPGRYGTLSEVAFALSMNKRVIGVHNNWDIPGIEHCDDLEVLKNIITEALS